MTPAYYDSAYLFKLQCFEPGTGEIRAHASRVRCLCSAIHSRAEFVSACHRKIREGHGTLSQLRAMLDQFQLDCRSGVIVLLPLNESIFDRVDSFFLEAPGSMPLRAADAMHLACAAEHGFTEVYSNDKHLLAAAPLFGLTGVNVIGKGAG
jgi:predicted nucleic acid-binding protein